MNAFMRRTTTYLQYKRRAQMQAGVVLIIALILLAVVSILVAMTLRSAISTETVSGNVRTTSLATQAAEVALRYCEEATIQIASGTVTFSSVPTILAYSANAQWSDTANWDKTPSPAFVLPVSAMSQSGLGATFKRPPECMVERLPISDSSGVVATASTYVITARGFGPEVLAADSARSRPSGSEVWLQSEIELQ
jgi:type IV pilus assembly protein PilX